MICHERDLADEDVEELAEELWTLTAEGRNTLAELVQGSKVARVDAALDEMSERGLARREADGRVLLTESGAQLAQRQVRRHRLAEILFTTVLEVADEEAVDRTACVI